MDDENIVLGLMSGTSLDGIDLAVCSFIHSGSRWKYRLLHGRTIQYSVYWKKKLSDSFTMSGSNLAKLDAEYGNFLGKICSELQKELKVSIDLISSHGHTVFHDPASNYTLQIGNGANIAAISNTPVVANFRVTDVASGGQGAPLVPVGDHYLFSEYQACLNLGGFANISFIHKSNRIAFDICPVNIALNYFAQKLDLEFDKYGAMAEKGDVNEGLLQHLDTLTYYQKKLPKSLGREWVESEFLPIVEEQKISVDDKLRTVVQHCINQIALIFREFDIRQVLLSGGGVYNTFLIESLIKQSDTEIVIPEKNIIDYKEAIIFAFLGLLRSRNEINCFSSVTGAIRDTSCGAFYLP